MRGISVRKLAAAAAVGGGGLTVLTGMSVGLVVAEAKIARRVIGEAALTPPRADGLFAAHLAHQADVATQDEAGVGVGIGSMRAAGAGAHSATIVHVDEQRARRERRERRGRARRASSGSAGYLYEPDAVGTAGVDMAAVVGTSGIPGTGRVSSGASASARAAAAAADNPDAPLRFAVLGDSTAAGYGVDRPEDTPGALLSVALAEHTGRPVLLSNVARVGACSDRLHEQIDQLLADGDAPQVAAIMIGANDITHRLPPVEAARQLGEAVTRLREAGCAVVVGTCPDLGTIRPIQPPLRWLARRWSRRLAKLQSTAVCAAGGRSVPLGALLGPEFARRPEMFGPDRFHPSAAGYATAVAALLPALAAASWQIVREPERDRGPELALPFAVSAHVVGGGRAAGSADRAAAARAAVAVSVAAAAAATDVASAHALDPDPQLAAAVLRPAKSRSFRRAVLGSGPDSAVAHG